MVGNTATSGSADQRAIYPPLSAHLAKSRSFIITLGLLTGVAALTVDLSLPAIPAMAEALDSTLSQGQQIIGIFLLGMALGQIPAGLASDRFGRLPILFIGMCIFVVSAIVTAVATDVNILLGARFAQGLGGAVSIVIARAAVRDIASGADAAKIMSLLMMIFTAAPVIAPSLGAILVTQWNWRAPFIVIAGCGALMLFATRVYLVETHHPNANQRPLRQLKSSFREFFSHRQSIFGLLLMIVPPAGYLSIIAVSSSLAVDIYGFSLAKYALIFAYGGLSILAGAATNRWLVTRFTILQILMAAVIIILVASVQLLIIAWLNNVPFWWLWFCVCMNMFTMAIFQANALELTLDPLPKIAGFASSIIGTSQNLVGAFGALLGALIYDGSVRNATIILGVSGTLTAGVFFLRPWIITEPLVHHPDELARD